MQTQVQLKPLNEVIHDRRATLDFDDVPVPDEVLRDVLEAGQKAPSGYNLQPWRFVVVRDAELRKALRAASFNQAKVEHAPVVIVACAALKAWQQGDLEESLRIAAEHGFNDPAKAEATRQAVTGALSGEPGDVCGWGPDWAVWGNR